MELFKVLLIGIVEGITEWLPVSSTGHMIILNAFLPLKVSPEFWSMFEVVIQLGAIMAVVILFWDKINPFGTGGDHQPLTRRGLGAYLKADIIALWFRIIVACIPAAIIGGLYNDTFEALFYHYESVAIALIVFGIAFIVIENKHKGQKARVNRLSEISYRLAALIGLFQLIAAIFPGTSRSGATIVGALILGVSRTVAAEFTFFLAIPVMFGASLLKLYKFGFQFTMEELIVLGFGMVVAFAVSMLTIGFLMRYVKKHDFKIFGWYRIALGGAILLLFGGR
jgi:undecaprenyl-diphosphatase